MSDLEKAREMRFGRMLAALEGVEELGPENVVVGRTFPQHPAEPILRYLIIARRREPEPELFHLSTQANSFEDGLNAGWERHRVIDLNTGEVLDVEEG